MEKEKYISLVEAVQKGDSEAANTLFSEVYNDVYYFALKTVKDSETAADVTQETLIEVFNNIGTLKDAAAFPAWCRQITYFQCTRYFRKKKDVLVEENEEGGSVFDTLEEDSAEFIPDEALDKKDFKKTVMEFIDTLSEEQRAAVIMYYFDELSISQIAEIQGVSEGTVKSRLNYARKAIKQLVEDYEKKNGIKLHAIPFLPFIKWLLVPDKAATAVPAALAEKAAEAALGSSAATAGVTSAAAEATVGGAIKATTGVVAKIVGAPLIAKIAAGVVAAAIITGASFGISSLVSNDSEVSSAPSSSAAQNAATEDVVWTDGRIDENTYILSNIKYTIYGVITEDDSVEWLWCANPIGRNEKIEEIEIVNEIEGIKVGDISTGFNQCYPNLKKVTIDMDHAREYADGAFLCCAKLEEVVITKNVKTFIVNFDNLQNLKKVKIEDGCELSYIGQGCFFNTAFYNDKQNWQDGFLIVNNVLLAADETVQYDAIIPEGVTCIASNIFNSHSKFEKLIVPSTLIYNLEQAFIRCQEVEISPDNPVYYVKDSYIINKQTKTLVWTYKNPGENEIPTDGSVKAIGNSAFYYVNYPYSSKDIPINIPEGIERVETNFHLCRVKITSLPSTLKYVGEDAFSNIKIVDFKMPSEIEEIGKDAFTNCGITGEVVIPNTVRSLPVDTEGNFLPILAENKITSLVLEEGNPLFEGKDEQTVIKQLLGK